jgi:hypothetical protein
LLGGEILPDQIRRIDGPRTGGGDFLPRPRVASRRPQPWVVGARNSATLGDLHVFVDGSAEPVTSNDLDIGCFGLGGCS